MHSKRYGPDEVSGLLPLLDSIGFEIEERSRRLATLEREIELLSSGEPFEREALLERQAEIATHRRGVRLARAELERLGCSLVGTEPLTFRIPGADGLRRRSFVWQHGRRAVLPTNG